MNFFLGKNAGGYFQAAHLSGPVLEQSKKGREKEKMCYLN